MTDSPEAMVELLRAMNYVTCDDAAKMIEAQAAEIEQARRTSDYWKAEHLAGNAKIDRLRAAVEALAAIVLAELVSCVGGERYAKKLAEYDAALRLADEAMGNEQERAA